MITMALGNTWSAYSDASFSEVWREHAKSKYSYVDSREVLNFPNDPSKQLSESSHTGFVSQSISSRGNSCLVDLRDVSSES